MRCNGKIYSLSKIKRFGINVYIGGVSASGGVGNREEQVGDVGVVEIRQRCVLDTHKNVSTSCRCLFVENCEVVFRNPNCHISVMCTPCWGTVNTKR